MAQQSTNILLVANHEQDYNHIHTLLSDIEDYTPFDDWVCYVEWVSTPVSARQMIERSRHDVYLIDLDFSEPTATENGHQHSFDLLDILIKQGISAPIIFLVDQPDKETLSEVMTRGVADYLSKNNLSPQLLERALRLALHTNNLKQLETAHTGLKKWARRRTARLKKTNHLLRQEIEEREKTQEALLQSEERYRTLIDNIQDGVFLVQDGKIEFTNEAFARMLGYQIEELRGQKFLNLIDRRDLELIAHRYGQMEVKPGVPKEYEFHLVHRDQHTRVMVNINVGLFTYKNKLASIGTVKDITVRKYAEEQLRKLSRVVHQSPISIMITDIQGSIEYVNPAFTTTTGYALKEVIGENPRVLKSGEHGIDVYEELWATIASGGTWRGELRNRKKNGELYWEFATISPIQNKSGRSTHYLAILEDVTDRKRVMAELRRHRHHLQELVDERTQEMQEINDRLQQEIQERERLGEVTRQGRERLRLQYNGIPVPTYTWQRVGRDFVLIDYNDAASKAINGRIIDYMGKKASDMFSDKPYILEDFKRCFLTKKTIRREAPYTLLTSGETRHYVTSYIYVPPNVVMVHMEDITRYKETEIRLNEAQQQLQQIATQQGETVVAENAKVEADIQAWQDDLKTDASMEVVRDEFIKLPLEQSVVGTWDWNVETGEMTFSAEWAEMLGYTSKEVSQNIRSWAGLMHLDDIAKVMDNLNNHFAGEVPYYEAEHRLKTKHGGWRWILGQGKVVSRDKNGRVLRMTGVHRDISERKQAEEALRRSHSWFHSLIETVSDWVWELDRNMVFTYVSPKVVDILGYAPEDVIGKKPFDFMPPDEAKRFKAVLTRRMKLRKPLITEEVIYEGKDKKLIAIETNGLPYFDEDGLFCGYRGAHRAMSKNNNNARSS